MRPHPGAMTSYKVWCSISMAFTVVSHRPIFDVAYTWIIDEMPLNDRLCVGFSDAEMLGSPHARTVGVGEAPRHEVAGGEAPSVQRALRGGAPGAPSLPSENGATFTCWHGS